MQHLLPNYQGPDSTSEAATSAKVVFIDRSEIDELLENEKFERNLWIMGFKRLLVICKEYFGEIGQLDSFRLNTLFSNSKLFKFTPGQEVPLSNGTIFLQGGVSSGHSALSYIPGTDRATAPATEHTVILQFEDDFGKFVRNSDTDLKSSVSAYELKGETQPAFKISKNAPYVKAMEVLLKKGLASFVANCNPAQPVPSSPRSCEDDTKLIPDRF